MTQPDNFGFGEEAALLKAFAHKFFSEKFPTSTLHTLVAGDHRPERNSECLWDRDLWQEMVDLGWTMLAVPESAGGVGMPAVAVAGLVEELGRAAFPCPLVLKTEPTATFQRPSTPWWLHVSARVFWALTMKAEPALYKHGEISGGTWW